MSLTINRSQLRAAVEAAIDAQKDAIIDHVLRALSAHPSGAKPSGPKPSGPKPAGPKPSGPKPSGAKPEPVQPSVGGLDESQLKEKILAAVTKSRYKGQAYYNFNTRRVNTASKGMQAKYVFYDLGDGLFVCGEADSDELNQGLAQLGATDATPVTFDQPKKKPAKPSGAKPSGAAKPSSAKPVYQVMDAQERPDLGGDGFFVVENKWVLIDAKPDIVAKLNADQSDILPLDQADIQALGPRTRVDQKGFTKAQKMFKAQAVTGASTTSLPVDDEEDQSLPEVQPLSQEEFDDLPEEEADDVADGVVEEADPDLLDQAEAGVADLQSKTESKSKSESKIQAEEEAEEEAGGDQITQSQFWAFCRAQAKLNSFDANELAHEANLSVADAENILLNYEELLNMYGLPPSSTPPVPVKKKGRRMRRKK